MATKCEKSLQYGVLDASEKDSVFSMHDVNEVGALFTLTGSEEG